MVDIETDESSPVLWETLAQIYQSYGAHYTGESLQAHYKELVKQAEESIAKDKQVTYPEIDLTVIFVQLYLESSPTGAVSIISKSGGVWLLGPSVFSLANAWSFTHTRKKS